MSADSQIYSAVVFLLPDGYSGNLRGLVPKKNVKTTRQTAASADAIKAQSFHFFSKVNYCRSVNAESHPESEKIKGVEHFVYEIYIFSFSIAQQRYCLVCTQYSALLKEICLYSVATQLKEYTWKYIRLDLQSIVESIQGGDTMGGKIRMSAATLSYRGKDHALLDNLVLSGKNIANSPIFKSIRNLLSEDPAVEILDLSSKGAKSRANPNDEVKKHLDGNTSIRRIKLNYGESRPAIIFEADLFGNFKLRIDPNIGNMLSYFIETLSHFNFLEATEPITTCPLLREEEHPPS